VWLGLLIGAFGCAPDMKKRPHGEGGTSGGNVGDAGKSSAGRGGKTSNGGGAMGGESGEGGVNAAGQPAGGQNMEAGAASEGGANTAGAHAARGGSSGENAAGMSGGPGAGSGGTFGGFAGAEAGAAAIGGSPAGGTAGTSMGGMGGEDLGGSGGVAGGSAGQGPACEVPTGTRLMESLGRGLVAVRTSEGVYLSWRLLGTDPGETAFNVYRGEERLNEAPITDSTNYLDPDGDESSSYVVTPMVFGVEAEPSAVATPMAENYVSIPLDPGTPQGASLVAVGDLDGDGEFDWVVKRGSQDVDPGSSAWTRSTDTFKLEAYSGGGAFLWRVDLGPNIEQGIWYSPFTVFDLDGDGKAEVVTKMGERLGEDLNGDAITDYRNAAGRVATGPEYLVVLDGLTGAVRARTNWIARGNIAAWGDSYGNRVNRNLMAVAYLDGQRPSLVMFRGTYALMKAEAWNFRAGALSKVWSWTTTSGGGFHNLRVGDIDEDGKDEIVNGSIAMDDDGSTLWVHGEGHGDRLHMTDIDPSRPGLEIFYAQEASPDHAHHLRDARTGALLWGSTGITGDNGRANCADVTAAQPGLECWSALVPGLYDANGALVSSGKPTSTNFSIWWDGDVVRELMDSVHIDKYGGGNLMLANGCEPGSRLAPMAYADLFGDWREEVIHHCGDALRIYTTTTLTGARQFTFMHDSDYRTSVAAETMGYMQSTQPSFHFGSGMAAPPVPRISTQCLVP
jgi:rhamnogalacturonan endolyase